MTGSTYQRTASDLEESVLSYSEVKALAIANPKMKELAEKENELGNMRILSDKFAEAGKTAKEDIDKLRYEIEVLDEQIRGSEKNIEYLADKTDKEYKTLRKVLSDMLYPEYMMDSGKHLGTILGFSIDTPISQNEEKPRFILKRNGANYTIESGKTASGNALRLTNFLQRLPKYTEELKEKLKKKKIQLSRLEDEANVGNPYIERIKKLQREISLLKEEIEYYSDDNYVD